MTDETVQATSAVRGRLSGTSLVGYLHTAGSLLVARLGPAATGDDLDNKIDAQWYVELDDGTPACIYNYHDGRSRRALDACWRAVHTVTCWHVAGHDPSVVDRLAAALGVQGVRLG